MKGTTRFIVTVFISVAGAFATEAQVLGTDGRDTRDSKVVRAHRTFTITFDGLMVHVGEDGDREGSGKSM